jgi:exopolyphosphatase/guanosine-5'-triphosphate,3'-diphosphate pyrophosphatase
VTGEGGTPFARAIARVLLAPEAIQRATVLGCAHRLADTLSAGTPDLLAGTHLRVNHMLTLRLAEGSGVFAGESVTRRLDRLAQALGVLATTELAA